MINSEVKRLKASELRFLCRELSIMLEAGYEIDRALERIIDDKGKKDNRALRTVKELIDRGMSVSEAFRASGGFTGFFISMVEAGELTGNLDYVMSSLSDYYEKEHSLKGRVINILIYPVILIITSIISVGFVLLKVIPGFADLFKTNSIKPPAITSFLLWLSELMNNNLPLIILGMVAIIGSIVYVLTSSPVISESLDRRMIDLPVVKRLYRTIVTVRFSRSMMMLTKSGIDILKAVKISAGVINNAYIISRLKISELYIERGNKISSSIAICDIFPPMFISIVSAGEESGLMERSLEVVTGFYEKELDTEIDRMIKLIEPTIILFMGIVLGSIVIAIVLPMFDAISSFST